MSAQFDQLVKKHTIRIAGNMAIAQAEIEAGVKDESDLVTVFEKGLREFAKDVFDLVETVADGQ